MTTPKKNSSAEAKPRLSHLNAAGEAHMVDVGEKPRTHRVAVATAVVHAKSTTIKLVASGQAPKGDVLAAIRIAGIMAAKKTAELIPLCHPLPLTRVFVSVELRASRIHIEAEAATDGQTGVEMEALTAASVAALTAYDMLKAVDKGMRFEVELTSKVGGKSGAWHRSAGKGQAK
jgi:cyclic pyranopterin monophosphate synthase